MSTSHHFRLSSASVLDVTGADAVKIVNNLTTNDICSLEDQSGRESFVTDVKGKTIGHVSVFRDGASLRLIGAAGQSERIAAHLDRYTIVEDATATICDGQSSVFVLPPNAVSRVVPDFQSGSGGSLSCKLLSLNARGYEVRWLGEFTIALISSNEDAASLRDHLTGLDLSQSGDESFHLARTIAGFPWLGIDFDENSLPQEVDRDQLAISFTKGCYLGQETVARLDAMGQVQKKLVRWKLSGVIPEPNVEVVSGGKTVGRLTSIAPTSDNEAVAIGIARRSHFEPGAVATGTSSQGEFTAHVC